MKILIGWVLPILCYAFAFSMIDASFWTEVLIGFLFIAGVNFSRFGDQL